MPERFNLKGSYTANKKKSILSGELELYRDNQFKGKLRESPMNSNYPQLILGRFNREESDRIILFQYTYYDDTKMHSASNVIYEFHKEANDLFEGKYVGEVSSPPFRLNCNYPFVLDKMDHYLKKRNLWMWSPAEINISKV